MLRQYNPKLFLAYKIKMVYVWHGYSVRKISCPLYQFKNIFCYCVIGRDDGTDSHIVLRQFNRMLYLAYKIKMIYMYHGYSAKITALAFTLFKNIFGYCMIDTHDCTDCYIVLRQYNRKLFLANKIKMVYVWHGYSVRKIS